jgi:hypothetical protein
MIQSPSAAIGGIDSNTFLHLILKDHYPAEQLQIYFHIFD